jgi:hypothetical protein
MNLDTTLDFFLVHAHVVVGIEGHASWARLLLLHHYFTTIVNLQVGALEVVGALIEILQDALFVADRFAVLVTITQLVSPRALVNHSDLLAYTVGKEVGEDGVGDLPAGGGLAVEFAASDGFLTRLGLWVVGEAHIALVSGRDVVRAHVVLGAVDVWEVAVLLGADEGVLLPTLWVLDVAAGAGGVVAEGHFTLARDGAHLGP